MIDLSSRRVGTFIVPTCLCVSFGVGTINVPTLHYICLIPIDTFHVGIFQHITAVALFESIAGADIKYPVLV